MFCATSETYKQCSNCNLKRTDDDCIVEIMCAIRHYIYQKIT